MVVFSVVNHRKPIFQNAKEREREQKRPEKREAKVTPEDTAQHMRSILSGMLVLEGRDRSLIML